MADIDRRIAQIKKMKFPTTSAKNLGDKSSWKG